MSLKRIAEMTGVSVSTVSRVLNNKGYNCASDKVKDKVWAAAREIHYIPNESARKLQRGSEEKGYKQGKKFAVVLGRFESLKVDPFFEEVYRSVEQEAFAQGCIIDCFFTASELIDQEIPDENGYILLGRSSNKLLKKIREKSRNIVAIDRNPTSFEMDEVVCDGREAAAKAMDYLVGKGYTKIGYIGDCSYEARYVGYCDTLIKNRIPINYSYIFPTEQTEDTGYAAMKKLMEQQDIEAVLCANDITAIGALHAYGELNKNKNKKIDVISIDNIGEAEKVSPLLTTIQVPGKDMGRMAVKILLDRIAKGHSENIRVEFPTKLIRRESC